MEELAPIFVLIVVLAGVMIVTFLSRDTDEAPGKPKCELHDWVLDGEEKLICMECGFRPNKDE